jgi:hypothetical protein
VASTTIKQKDGENDRASNLDRSGGFCLNCGIYPYANRNHLGPEQVASSNRETISLRWVN